MLSGVGFRGLAFIAWDYHISRIESGYRESLKGLHRV